MTPAETASATEVHVPACILPALKIRVGDVVRLAGSEWLWTVTDVFSDPWHPARVELSGIVYRPHRQEIHAVTRPEGQP